MSIGCITIDQKNPETVWVGTGETNMRNSVSVGTVIYRSTDGGKTWKLMGLTDSERISEIRGRGPMIALELDDGPGVPLTIAVHRDLVNRGYIPGRRPGVSVTRLDPALTIDREDIEGFLTTLGEVMEAG